MNIPLYTLSPLQTLKRNNSEVKAALCTVTKLENALLENNYEYFAIGLTIVITTSAQPW